MTSLKALTYRKPLATTKTKTTQRPKKRDRLRLLHGGSIPQFAFAFDSKHHPRQLIAVCYSDKASCSARLSNR